MQIKINNEQIPLSNHSNLDLVFWSLYFQIPYPKDLISEKNQKKFKKENEAFLKTVIDFLEDFKLPKELGELINSNPHLGIPNENKFLIQTQNMGFISGVGYSHEMGIEGEAKFGIDFDFTLGVPVYRGSGIKGGICTLAEDWFSNIINKEAGLSDITIKILTRIGKNKWVHWLEKGNQFGQINFLDAFAIKSAGPVFHRDAFAPHTAGPFKNPNPLTFLKVNHSVTFQFAFEFCEFKVNETETIPVEEIRKLFRFLLLKGTFGAKGTVNYGRFEEKTAGN